jgi:hypothetical protein
MPCRAPLYAGDGQPAGPPRPFSNFELPPTVQSVKIKTLGATWSLVTFV